jgi:hypothetical protein
MAVTVPAGDVASLIWGGWWLKLWSEVGFGASERGGGLGKQQPSPSSTVRGTVFRQPDLIPHALCRHETIILGVAQDHTFT